MNSLRLGLRHLTENRGPAAAALLILTLGAAAAGAALAFADAVLLHGVPFPDPSRLVVLSGTFTDKSGAVADWPISQLDFADWRRLSRSFVDMSVYNPDGDLALNLEGVAEPERLKGELVSASYFPLLGVTAERGRFFSPQEDSKPFTDYVAVLGHDLWRRRFAGDAGAVGRSVRLNGQSYRVVGIAPAGFRGLPDTTDLWIPSQLPPIPEYVHERVVRWVTVLARLRPGVTVAQAQREMDGITAALARQYPGSNKGMGARIATLAEVLQGDQRHGLRDLTLGALAVLAAAAFDAGLLVFAGGGGATAAGRRLPAALLLSLAGAVLGLALAQWAAPALMAAGGVELPSWSRVSVWRPEAAAAAIAATVLCGIVFGLLAAGADRRWRNAVVAAQTGVAVVLLTITGVGVAGYRQLLHQDLGFKPDHLLTYRIDIRGPKYDAVQAVRDVVRKYLEQLPRVPGVAALAMANPTIPGDGWAGTYISIEGHPSDSPAGTFTSMVHAVTADYFALLDIPLLAGRTFGEREWLPGGVVVSKATAEKYWPGQSPLGKRIKNGRADATDLWFTVLGVAAEVRHEGIGGDPRPAPDVYFPLTQLPMRLPLTVNFLIRPAPGVAVAALVPALRRQMREISADLPMFDVATLDQRLGRQARKARLPVLLDGLFAALAVALTAAGLAGMSRFPSSGILRTVGTS